MISVTLYEEVRPDIRISMEMYFESNGDLIFDGCDYGKTVLEYWGDTDYEYTYTITPQEVNKIYDLLGVPKGEKEKLLRAILLKFHGNSAYKAFGEFMDENGVVYKGFTYA
jgi:hypothetical protein